MRSRTTKQPSLFFRRREGGRGLKPTNGLARRERPGHPTKVSSMGVHVWARKSGRHPHWTCMLSLKDKLEFSYRTLNFGTLVKIIIEFHAITSKKKNEVGYFSKCSRLVRLPSTLPPPRVHIHIHPPTPIFPLAFLAVLRFRCQQSSTSSSKSVAFFSHHCMRLSYYPTRATNLSSHSVT